MKIRLLVAVLALVLLLVSCAEVDLSSETPEDRLSLPETQSTTVVPDDSIGYPVITQTEEPMSGYPIATVPTGFSLLEAADIVVEALSQKDMATVAEFVHLEMGLRFSPYTYVDEDHLVFLPEELPGLPGSGQVYVWGSYDGSGDPIALTFDEYHERFLFSADFTNPEQTAVNEELGSSSMINNISDFYPESSFVEYYFSGFEEEYEGIDWVSLRLVFIQEEGTWYLVGLVNDQWTI